MPRQVDHEAYRSDLVERCTPLFAEEGYAPLTMRRIAQHLGVSTGTLYHYFPNKEALFKQVARHVAAEDLGQARVAIPEGLSTAARARAVLTYVEMMERYFLQQNLVLIEYFRTIDPDDIRHDPALRGAADFYQGTVAEMLGIDRDRAKAVLMFLKGLILQRLYDGGLTTFADQAPYLEALLTD